MAARARTPSVIALRAGLAIAALAGSLCLIAATFATVIKITVGTSTHVAGADLEHSGWDRHGPALVLLALLGLALLGPALRGVRAATLALAVTGVAAVLIAMAWDRPHVHDTGSVGDVYADATAGPGAGYYLETLGGALLLLAGGGLMVLGAPERAPAPTRRRPSEPVAEEE